MNVDEQMDECIVVAVRKAMIEACEPERTLLLEADSVSDRIGNLLQVVKRNGYDPERSLRMADGGRIPGDAQRLGSARQDRRRFRFSSGGSISAADHMRGEL